MQTVIPINYNLEFETDLKNFTFDGREVIEIKCLKSVNSITLDAADLKIKKCYLLHGKIPVSTFMRKKSQKKRSRKSQKKRSRKS